MRRWLLRLVAVVAVIALILAALSWRRAPASITYGASFSPLYATEIGLDWKAVYRAMLDELGVRHLRLSAYWPMIEPARGQYAWQDLDFQVNEAQKHQADVILAVGRRLPRWPECHVPRWAEDLSWDEQKAQILAQIRAVIERYKDNPIIVMWQVENEPFLPIFADSACGEVDQVFFEEEVALVHSLDPRPVMVTDGGNLGTWVQAYRAGDVFGTSEYLYFWNETAGAFRTAWPPSYYRIKANLMRLFGAKRIILSELSLEPWLGASISSVSLDEQLSRMNAQKFDEIVAYAKQTRFDTQYLWGVEWWYYMRGHDHAEFWDKAAALFKR